MIQRIKSRSTLASLAASAAFLLQLGSAATALAQVPPESGSIVVGAWTFKPEAELRVRGEYRREPIDGTGNGMPVHWDSSAGSWSLESVPSGANTKNAWAISERTRLGLSVERAQVTAKLVLQDARMLGDIAATQVFPSEVFVSNLSGLGGLGTIPSARGFSLFESYIDIHSTSGRPMFLRVGRQRVVWGEGRLLGESDWTLSPRSLDAARFGVELGDFDLELLAALLVPPGTYLEPARSPTSAQPSKRGSGAQLYGVDLVWHGMPLLNAEFSALARISRTFSSPSTGLLGNPTPSLMPGDTITLDGRVFGDYRGFRYSAEGAYQFGRVASYGVNRDISAFALAARASLETALPWHLTFGAHGDYASGAGENSGPQSIQKRFDPLLADAYQNVSPMGFHGWSNILSAGGFIHVKPADWYSAQAGYRFATLANAKDRWMTSTYATFGSDDTVDTGSLGHEIDTAFTFNPWDVVEFKTGYSLFVYGKKAKALVRTTGDGDMQHWVYFQTLVRVP